MKKIRIAYSKLAFGVRYALAYVWTVIMVMGIAFGVNLTTLTFG